MIIPTYIKNYKTSDGTVFKTVEEAQYRESEILFDKYKATTESLSTFVMRNKDFIVDILTMTDKTKIKVSHKKKDPKVMVSPTIPLPLPLAPNK